jgi:hypothetical protein
MLALLLLAGCNSYEMFRVTGFEQANFTNDADILFVIDNSGSMQEEAEALARNFDGFISKLTSAEGSNPNTATLSDAVGNYIQEHKGDSLFIDYQLGITTTAVIYTGGESSGAVDPGEGGLLIGPVITRGQEDAGGAFTKQLLCEATCWSSATMPSDPSVTECADGVPETISVEYLDCLCGVDEWKGNCGSGQEMGIEAGLMALCRSVESPPADCYEFPDSAPVAFVEGDELSNDGLLRADANTIVVVVTDEGDDSPRKEGTGDTDVEPYLDLFAQFPNIVRFAIIGPPYDGSNGDCLDGAQPWGVERYQNIATGSGGIYIDLTDAENGCAANDFGANLEQLGDLLSQLQTLFPLQTIPDAATIRAWVDGDEVLRSVVTEGSEETGDAVYSDGWSYDAAYNAVRFNGNAVPGFNADVRIYYRPLAGMPRELPF